MVSYIDLQGQSMSSIEIGEANMGRLCLHSTLDDENIFASNQLQKSLVKYIGLYSHLVVFT